MMYTLPDLPYAYDALEPYIDAQTMKIHHTKHHQAYINNLNKALEEKDELLSKSLEDLLSDLSQVPEEIRTMVRNNGGGHHNHSLFWNVMKKDGNGEPGQELIEAINRDLGGFVQCKEDFTKTAMNRFGSGWAWVSVKDKTLKIHSTPNQDSPFMEGLTPILGLDVWEHAYYLKYQNKRPDYIDAWWNVVNWQQVRENYLEALN